MKRKLLSVLLVCLSAVVLLCSACFISLSCSVEQYGLLPYAVIHYDLNKESGVRVLDKIDIKTGNILVMLSFLWVSAFVAGLLWARSSEGKADKLGNDCEILPER